MEYKVVVAMQSDEGSTRNTKPVHVFVGSDADALAANWLDLVRATAVGTHYWTERVPVN